MQRYAHHTAASNIHPCIRPPTPMRIWLRSVPCKCTYHIDTNATRTHAYFCSYDDYPVAFAITQPHIPKLTRRLRDACMLHNIISYMNKLTCLCFFFFSMIYSYKSTLPCTFYINTPPAYIIYILITSYHMHFMVPSRLSFLYTFKVPRSSCCPSQRNEAQQESEFHLLRMMPFTNQVSTKQQSMFLLCKLS